MGFFDFFKKEPTNKEDAPKTTQTSITTIKKDYATTIFLNKYGSGQPILKHKEYPGYFEYELNIPQPQLFHKELLENGYLRKATLSESLGSCKVTELKAILESFNLPKSGNKKALIERILTLSSEQLETLNNSFQKYSLSEKGQAFIEQNIEYILLFKNKHWNISLEEYIETKNLLPSGSRFYDIAWRIFNDRNWSYNNDNKFLFLSGNYQYMAELSEMEEANENALSFYLHSLFYDVIGENMYTISLFQDGVYQLDDLKKHYIEPVLNYIVINKIATLKKHYKDSMAKEIYEQNYSSRFIKLCDKEHFEKLVLEIIQNSEIDRDKWQLYFKSSYKAMINNLS